MIRIAWTEGRWLPTYVKGGAMGMVAGDPVYAAGISQPWRETELTWRYDGNRGDWVFVEPMPVGRCYTSSATAGEGDDAGLLVVGGRRNRPGEPLVIGDAWLLRRIDGRYRWEELPSLAQPRLGASIGVIDGVAYVVGGGDWERVHGGAFTADPVTKVEALDLADPSPGWREVCPPPFSPRSALVGAVVGGAFCVFGGYNARVDAEKKRSFTYYGDAFRYDPRADRWERIRPMPVECRGGAAVAWGDRYAVILGGVVGTDVAGQTLMVQTTRKDSRGLLVGGYSDLVWVYDAVADRYELLADRMPWGLNDTRACVAGDRIYVAGGETIDVSTSNTSNAFMIGTVSDE